jgi:hypothetical protein
MIGNSTIIYQNFISNVDKEIMTTMPFAESIRACTLLASRVIVLFYHSDR